MPPVMLGAIVSATFGLAFCLRRIGFHWGVKPVPKQDQPRRQFMIEYASLIVSGILAMFYLYLIWDFPFSSGIRLLIGFIVLGMFTSLDMALIRERMNIMDALTRNPSFSLPEKMFPITRKLLIIAGSVTIFAAVILGLVISYDVLWISRIDTMQISLEEAIRSVLTEIVFIMMILLGMVFNLIFSFSKNMSYLFQSETRVLSRVSQGDLASMVPVITNDEFGMIAGYTNMMIKGLRHGMHLMAAMKVAEEVQQTLLPPKRMQTMGVDIAGCSLYCDETGGDFFDYFRLPGDRLGIVVGDASDHGVGSALYMATGRAFVRFGASCFGHPQEVVSHVNRFLCQDSGDTGRFMTLFYLDIHIRSSTLRWVRAGHEPAIFYDPSQDRFQDLSGSGIALGLMDTCDFLQQTQDSWHPGSILAIVTDGVLETRDPDGNMFGKDRLQRLIRQHAHGTSDRIMTEILKQLKQFRGQRPLEDDVTLIIVKLP